MQDISTELHQEISAAADTAIKATLRQMDQVVATISSCNSELKEIMTRLEAELTGISLKFEAAASVRLSLFMGEIKPPSGDKGEASQPQPLKTGQQLSLNTSSPISMLFNDEKSTNERTQDEDNPSQLQP